MYMDNSSLLYRVKSFPLFERHCWQVCENVVHRSIFADTGALSTKSGLSAPKSLDDGDFGIACRDLQSTQLEDESEV